MEPANVEAWLGSLDLRRRAPAIFLRISALVEKQVPNSFAFSRNLRYNRPTVTALARPVAQKEGCMFAMGVSAAKSGPKPNVRFWSNLADKDLVQFSHINCQTFKMSKDLLKVGLVGQTFQERKLYRSLLQFKIVRNDDLIPSEYQFVQLYDSRKKNEREVELGAIFPYLVQLGLVGMGCTAYLEKSRVFEEGDRISIGAFMHHLVEESYRPIVLGHSSPKWDKALWLAKKMESFYGLNSVIVGNTHVSDFQEGFEKAEKASGLPMDAVAFDLSYRPIPLCTKMTLSSMGDHHAQDNVFALGASLSGSIIGVDFIKRSRDGAFLKYYQGKPQALKLIEFHARVKQGDPEALEIMRVAKEDADVVPQFIEPFVKAAEEGAHQDLRE
jgi:hypothetical protein